MTTPPVLRTRESILAELNRSGQGQWVEIEGTFSVSAPTIKGNVVNFALPVRGILLTVFVNTETAEIKTFAAKMLDVPDRDALWEAK